MSAVESWTIVHIEDEATNFRSLPRKFSEVLTVASDSDDSGICDVRYSFAGPHSRYDPVATFFIHWRENDLEKRIKYVFALEENAAGLDAQMEGDRGIFFILDAMRPGSDGKLQSLVEVLLEFANEAYKDRHGEIVFYSAYPQVRRLIADIEPSWMARFPNISYPVDVILKGPPDAIIHRIARWVGLGGPNSG